MIKKTSSNQSFGRDRECNLVRFKVPQYRFGTMPCINLYPTIACVVCKNGNHKLNTIAQYAMKSSELSIKDFIAFLYAQK